jgi:hypothetical protein
MSTKPTPMRLRGGSSSVGSMSGGNVAPEIANYKGQIGGGLAGDDSKELLMLRGRPPAGRGESGFARSSKQRRPQSLSAESFCSPPRSEYINGLQPATGDASLWSEAAKPQRREVHIRPARAFLRRPTASRAALETYLQATVPTSFQSCLAMAAVSAR